MDLILYSTEKNNITPFGDHELFKQGLPEETEDHVDDKG
jgi:hypothetical protein